MNMIQRTHISGMSSCWSGKFLSQHRLGWSWCCRGNRLGVIGSTWSRTNLEPRFKSHRSHKRYNRHFANRNRMQDWVES